MKLIPCLLVTVLGFSCNTTKITSSWKAENAVTKPYHNVMVWGILPEKDSTLRKQIENHLVYELAGKGYHAFSSLEVYKLKAYKKLTAKEIVDEFNATGVDAVITMVLLDKVKEEIYYPGSVLNQPGNMNGNLDYYYSTTYDKVFSPGYYISTTNYFWEANLFEVAGDKLTYSVRTKSFEPLSTEALAHENAMLIMKDMQKKKVILDHVQQQDRSN